MRQLLGGGVLVIAAIGVFVALLIVGALVVVTGLIRYRAVRTRRSHRPGDAASASRDDASSMKERALSSLHGPRVIGRPE